MEMMILAASNLPCQKCRELACSLIKSVDAFEILASGNSGIPNEVLIETIRQIVAKTLTKEDKDEEPEEKNPNVDNITNSNSNLNTKIHVINSCSLNVDIPMQIPTPAFDDHLLDYGEAEKLDDHNMRMKTSDTTTVQCRGRGRGRGRRGRKRHRILTPQKPVTRRKRYKSVESGEEEEESSDFSNSNPSCRTLATERDYDRASQYMKKVEMETRDGFFYNLFECVTCTRQFSQSQNLRRHIVSLHFNKKVITLGRATRQMVKYNCRDGRRMTKVRLYAKPGSSSHQKGMDSSSSFCLVPTNPVPEQTRGSKGKSMEIQMQLENQHQSHKQYHNKQILSKYGLPLDFMVRNPCKNFDLEKTLNARVSLSSISILSNLINSKSDNSAMEVKDEKPEFKEEIPDILVDDKTESTSLVINMDTSHNHSIPSQETPPKSDYSPGFNYDKIDLIEMDVDTIMAIDF